MRPKLTVHEGGRTDPAPPIVQAPQLDAEGMLTAEARAALENHNHPPVDEGELFGEGIVVQAGVSGFISQSEVNE